MKIMSPQKSHRNFTVGYFSGIKGGIDGPDIRRKLEDDENKNKKISQDNSLGILL